MNAWKQWISVKNGLMDQGSSRKFKNFKTDLLQLTPSELNYSLSLFVKEVTRPNGQPYTAGALFYLLLGKNIPYVCYNDVCHIHTCISNS